MTDLQKMQMSTWFEHVINIYMDAAISFKYAYYLQFPDQTTNHKQLIEKFVALKTLKNAAARVAVIELCKLFINSNNNVYNFHKFFNKLINGEFGKEFKQHTKLIDWQSKLIENSSLINNVVDLRDKVFAHQDSPEKVANLQSVLYSDVEHLIKMAQTILRFFLNEFFEEGSFNSDPNPGSLKDLLNHLKVE